MRPSNAAVAAHPHGQVVLHDLANLWFAQQIVGSQGVLDACGGIHIAGGYETEVFRRVGVVPQLAQAPGQLGRRAQRWHTVAADEPGDRGMVHAGLLGKLPLRHLLGFELSSKPVVERSAVLSGHMCLNAPLVYPFEGALAQLSAGCRHGCITHSYRAGAPRRRAQGRVWCGLVWCGPGAGEYLA